MERIKVVMVGAWGRNYGDRAIQRSLSQSLDRAISRDSVRKTELEYVDIQAGPVTDELLEQFNQANLVVVGGGGLLWNKPELQSRSGWQWDITTEQLAKIKPPIAVIGVGCTVFPHFDNTGQADSFRDTVGWLLDYAADFSVRNRGTATWLREHISDADPALVPDPAAFLWPAPYRPDGLGQEPVVGVCWASDKQEWRYGSRGAYNSFLERSAYGIALGAKERGAQVLFIEHLASVEAHARNVFRDAARSFGVPFVSMEEGWSQIYPATLAEADTMFAAYKHCDMVFSVRKHGLIVPAARGKPVVGLGNVDEIRWIQEDAWWPVPLRLVRSDSYYLETQLARYVDLIDGLTPDEAEDYVGSMGYARGVYEATIRRVARAALQ